MIFNMSGGGGTNLNFKVVGGTTEPVSPKENTIWVNTDTAITSWLFSAKDPYFFTKEIYTSVGAKSGYYLDSSGNEVANSNYKALTDKIPLPDRTTHVEITASVSSANACHAFYDVNGNFLSTVYRTAGTVYYTVPNGAKSIRVSMRNEDTASIIAHYTEAEESPEGMVWFSTSTSSPVDFNALKKSESKTNDFIIYPASAKQYIGGAWVEVTAKSYQGGVWVDWFVYLYNKGNECTGITGGWVFGNNANNTHEYYDFYTTGCSIERKKNTDSIYLYLNGSSGSARHCAASVGTAQAVNMERYNTLHMRYDLSSATANLDHSGAWKPLLVLSGSSHLGSSVDDLVNAAIATAALTKDGNEATIDISNVDSAFVVVSLALYYTYKNGVVPLDILEIWMT